MAYDLVGTIESDDEITYTDTLPKSLSGVKANSKASTKKRKRPAVDTLDDEVPKQDQAQWNSNFLFDNFGGKSFQGKTDVWVS